MSAPDREPLTEEERALARRLSALPGAGEPSQALDARVRAAARAAQVAPPRLASARRRRWPAMLGLAASLVLAVGVAWQLRLQPESPPAPREDRFVITPAVSPPAPAADRMQTAPGRTAVEDADSGRANAAKEAAVPALQERRAPAGPAVQRDTMTKDAPSVAGQQSAAKATSPRDIPTPMSLPPPPPPPPPSVDDLAPVASPSPAAPAPMAAPAAAKAAPDLRAGNEARQAEMAADRSGDEPEDEVPPATADSPAVRDAWLQRIRGLLGSGDLAGARASLRAFVHRYPDYVLPDDLRALEP